MPEACWDEPHHPAYYAPNSGPNIESNIETPPATKLKGSRVTTMLTTSYISGASRDRTGDLWLAKNVQKYPIPVIFA